MCSLLSIYASFFIALESAKQKKEKRKKEIFKYLKLAYASKISSFKF